MSSSFYHVAFLLPHPFEQMQAGTKRTEYRVRQRPDRTIEQLRPGVPIIFRLIGLTRGPNPTGPALMATCTRVRRSARPRGELLYSIGITDVRAITCAGSIVQGWRYRRGQLLRDHDHLEGALVQL